MCSLLLSCDLRLQTVPVAGAVGFYAVTKSCVSEDGVLNSFKSLMSQRNRGFLLWAYSRPLRF